MKDQDKVIKWPFAIDLELMQLSTSTLLRYIIMITENKNYSKYFI